MIELKGYYNNHYIVVYDNLPYIVKYYLEPEAVDLFTGRWKVHRPWKKYDGTIPKTCENINKFENDIENYIKSNKEKLDKRYQKIKDTIEDINEFEQDRDTKLLDIVPLDKLLTKSY